MKNLIVMLILTLIVLVLSIGCDNPPRNLPTAPDTYIDSIPYPIYIYVIDSIQVHDTTLIDRWHYDTTLVVITEHDTTYIPVNNLVYREENPWILPWQVFADTVYLHNPEGRYIVLFDRKTLGAKPDCLEPVIRINGHKQYFSVYGDRVKLYSIGPIDVPANAAVIIEFIPPEYGKISPVDSLPALASPTCHDYLSGKDFFFLDTDSISYR
ncbi:MAG: hypothetical protein PHY34_01220 [Patescibacteria group bacterium]|nr:hypothetical protein [Patescibacteria group bacterium]MDD5715161.1 hypothetical protein [Patescibacteria group bacterium]